MFVDTYFLAGGSWNTSAHTMTKVTVMVVAIVVSTMFLIYAYINRICPIEREYLQNPGGSNKRWRADQNIQMDQSPTTFKELNLLAEGMQIFYLH